MMAIKKVAKLGNEIKFPVAKSKEDIERDVWLSSLKSLDYVAIEMKATFEDQTSELFFIEDIIDSIEKGRGYVHIFLKTTKKMFNERGSLIGEHPGTARIVPVTPFVKSRIVQQLYVVEIQRLCSALFKRVSIKESEQNLRLALAVLNQLNDSLDLTPEDQSKLFEKITTQIKNEPAKEIINEETSLEKRV